MQVTINKEIRDYNEEVLFGLSLRQFIFSAMACVAAVITYFALGNRLGVELTSWVCIISVLPFAFLGFVKYNGMTAEILILSIIKTRFLIPDKLTFKSNNLYYKIFKKKGG